MIKISIMIAYLRNESNKLNKFDWIFGQYFNFIDYPLTNCCKTLEAEMFENWKSFK